MKHWAFRFVATLLALILWTQPAPAWAQTATDVQLVTVNNSPTGPISTPIYQSNTTTLQNAATANGNGATMQTQGMGTVALSVTGTFNGATVSFQGTIDGTNWYAINCLQSNGSSPVVSTTSAGIYFCSAGGLAQVRAPISSAGGSTVLTVIGSTAASGGSSSAGGGGGASSSTLTNCSGTITTGGTAQSAVAAATSPARYYLFVLNPSSATETLYMNLAGTASTSDHDGSGTVALSVGQSFLATVAVPQNAVSLNAATTGHAFTCWKG